MAARMLQRAQAAGAGGGEQLRVLTGYLPGFPAAASRLRQVAAAAVAGGSQQRSSSNSSGYVTIRRAASDTGTSQDGAAGGSVTVGRGGCSGGLVSTLAWPDPLLGPVAEGDRRFPLPGHCTTRTHAHRSQPLDVGKVLGCSGEVDASSVDGLLDTSPITAGGCDLSSSPTNEEAAVAWSRDGDQSAAGTTVGEQQNELECAAYECPYLVRTDLQCLFPERDICNQREPFTVLTLSHRTSHDMSRWSEDMEVEREALIKQFISEARSMCECLEQAGYWADFIDPSSGRPYLGPYTNATLFETDERYRRFGVRVEDVGCCRVVTHPAWGRRAFIGTLCTNAPTTSDSIRALTDSTTHG